MSPSILVLVGAIGLAVILLIAGIVYERRRTNPDYFERTRSARYDILMRDHRTGFLWTTGVAIVLVVMALAEWSSFNFRGEWPSTSGHVINVTRSEARTRIRYTDVYRTTYHVTAHYSYTVNDQQYSDLVTFSYDDASSRDQRASSLMGGELIPVWYHPLLNWLHFGSAVGPIYDMVILCIAGFVGIGSLSSLSSMLRLKLTDGY